MSFMNRAKAAAEQVKARAQEGVEEVQARKELAEAYWDLGHKAHELASSGAISHPELDPLVQRISELLARDGSQAGGSPAGGSPAGGSPAGADSGPQGTSQPDSGPQATSQPEQTTTTTPPQTPA